MPIGRFTIAELPAAEEERLTALRRYKLLDTPREPAFDALVEEVAKFFAVPTALITLVDRDRQWFKARRGLSVPSTPRAPSFCGHAIHGGDVFVVPNAADDERFAGNPLVLGEPFIRFYAGAPLVTPDGYAIGTLCLIDSKPRPSFGAADQARLAAYAKRVIALAEARLSPAAAAPPSGS